MIGLDRFSTSIGGSLGGILSWPCLLNPNLGLLTDVLIPYRTNWLGSITYYVTAHNAVIGRDLSGSFYVDKTIRPFQVHVQEHLYAAKICDLLSPIGRHRAL